MIRPILKYGDDLLHHRAEPIAAVTPDIDRIVEDMIETMYAAPGVGLAGPQVGVSQRLFVFDDGQTGPLFLANAAAWLCSVPTIFTPVRSMPEAAATARIFASGPTSTGTMRPFAAASSAPRSESVSQGCTIAVITAGCPAHRSMRR